MLRHLLIPALVLLAMPVQAQQQPVETILAAAPQGTRFGLLVVDATGRDIVAVAPEQRFIPASNTKMFTTAAAWALLPGIDKPDEAGGTEVRLRPGKRKGMPDVWLTGRGDARMSSAPDCAVDCLAQLADAVAARTRTVGDVWGDDTWFPAEPWSPGMSWNNIGTDSGTAISALSLDSNELTVSVTPGALGEPPKVTAPAYVTIENTATTRAQGPTDLRLEHGVNSRNFRLFGVMPATAGEWREKIGIDDPAHYAGWMLAEMLKARGVKVSGRVKVLHRPLEVWDDPKWRAAQQPPVALGALPMARRKPALEPAMATLVPPPLAEDVVTINQVSQNHHSEVLLRRLGSLGGLGSLADGLAAARSVFERAGIPRAGYDFSDGSGMSTYNRLSPRASVALLRWIATQTWGEAWYASLSVAGIDGTLKRRFLGTPLEGNLAAKTGTLNATNALSGRFRAKSGQLLTFAFFANDVPDGGSALATMEQALLAIHAAN